jgi:hypothetical protein
VKHYPSKEYFRKILYADFDKLGIEQSLIDELYIQVLQEYRIAAAFVIGVLSVIETKDDRMTQGVKDVITKCEEVLSDDSVYEMTGRSNRKISKKLEDAVKKADDVICIAEGLCNCALPLAGLPDNVLSVVLRARDICMHATRRRRYS